GELSSIDDQWCEVIRIAGDDTSILRSRTNTFTPIPRPLARRQPVSESLEAYTNQSEASTIIDTTDTRGSHVSHQSGHQVIHGDIDDDGSCFTTV
nr:hypothetical protein [Tanacetum cinerariifolium]